VTLRPTSALRAFRRPRLWLSLWAAMIVAVIVLSLMRKPPIPPTLMIGKLDHLIAYFALAAMAVQLYAARRAQLGAGLALVGLGIALELAQGLLTSYRHMAAYDALVDALGVALGIATGWTSFATILSRFDLRTSG
jgi:VanZ family protein